MDTKNDFSKGSVAKNIWSLAVPMTVAQLVNVLYSVVDRIYIGHLPDASTEGADRDRACASGYYDDYSIFQSVRHGRCSALFDCKRSGRRKTG